MFDPFSRFTEDHHRKTAGAGLGMLIVKALCELLGGTVGVESDRGVGTTFTVDLLTELPLA